MSKLPKDVVKQLLSARRAATMEKFRHGFPNDRVTVKALHDKNETVHPTEYIKEATRLYRQSWIITPIDLVFEWAGLDPETGHPI